MHQNDFSDFHYNIIGQSSFIKGEVELMGDSIICHKVEGTIRIHNESKLTLERKSHIIGKIFGHDIEVFGVVEGDIQCTGTLTIRSGASLSGKIRSGKLIVYPGAIVNIEAETKEL